MKKTLLPILACPICESSFSLTSFKEEDIAGTPEVKDGLLTCEQNHSYIITGYIPRMLVDMLPEFPEFAREHKMELQGKNVISKAPNEFKELQEKTNDSFSFEWQKWNRFGWDDSVPLSQTKDIFDYKVLFRKEELEGKLLLDAGCGNGRYTKIAREYGAKAVGIDLSRAVDEAFKNFKGDPDAHFVQGDLFNLPFKRESFDFIFSNGVLMHTGNAKRAFMSLVSRLKETGIISAHLYHKGNVVYEFNDWWLRVITTRLPFNVVYAFSKTLVAIAKALPKKFVMYGLNALFRIEDHEHYVFDWYTAPIATHHTYPEVYGWLKEAKLNLIADHNKSRHPWRKWVLPFQFLTVKAGKAPYPSEKISHTTS